MQPHKGGGKWDGHPTSHDYLIRSQFKCSSHCFGFPSYIPSHACEVLKFHRLSDTVAPSAYLALLHAISAFVKVILPVSLPSSEPSLFDDALSYWSEGHDFQLPVGVDDALKQKSWDQQRALAAVHQLVKGVVNEWC